MIAAFLQSVLLRLRTGWQQTAQYSQAVSRFVMLHWPESPEIRKKTLTRFSLIFGTFFIIVVVGHHIGSHQRQARHFKQLKAEQITNLNSIQHIIVEKISDGLNDLVFLSVLPELEDYLSTGNKEELQLLGLDLLGLVQLREDYSKIRVIDRSGVELMLVDNQNGKPRRAPLSELQNKSDRDYFKALLKLKPGEVFLSPIDYGEEQGKIELPFNPTFRLITGAFTENKQLSCSLVISFYGNRLFQQIQESEATIFKFWLVSGSGDWIREPGRPFQTVTHPSQAFDRLGDLQHAVLTRDSGQMSTAQGLFAFRRFNPLIEAINAHPGLKQHLQPASLVPSENWIVVSQITSQTLNELEPLYDGTSFIILLLLLGPGSIGSWFLAHAITLKIEADRHTREARNALQQITDSIPGAVYELDFAPGKTAHFLFLSRGAHEIFGEQPHNVKFTYDDFLTCIIPSDRKEYDDSLNEAYRTGLPWTCEFRIYDRNSCLKWIRSSAHVTEIDPDCKCRHINGIFTDITSLKVAEIKRKSSEERLDLALRATNDGLWDWNVAEGTVHFSPRWLQMLGYDPHELPHHFNTWKSLIHPDDLKRAMQQLSYNIENKSSHYDMEFRLRTKSGGWKWIMCRGAVVHRDPLGRPERMVGTHTDISERKELETKLKQTKDAAEQANKAKSAFLAIMSHELRTPMNSVCGFADSLQHTTLTPEQQDCVNTIEKSAAKLLFIINDILDYSKIEAGRLKLENIAFDFISTVSDTADMLRPQLEAKHLQFELIIEGPKSLPVKGDPTRLHQVVVNLIANAIKFTDKGTITLKIQSRKLDGNQYEIETSVRDSGIGMTIDQQAVLFQPFSQVDSSTTRKYGGTGLGLAICKRLCEMMNGHIWVVSQPGQGSTFSFDLKLDGSKQALPTTSPLVKKATADTNRSQTNHAKFTWKVLLADSDPVSCNVTTALLTEIGCEVKVIDSSTTPLTPELLRSHTALLFDDAARKNGLFEKASEQVKQLQLSSFHFFGLTETPAESVPDSIAGWIAQPVDIRNLSRAFAKVANAAPGAALSS